VSPRGLALLLVPIAACSPPGESNGSQGRELAATVTAVSRGGADCAIRWNGVPVSQEALLEHGLTVNREALERVSEKQRGYPPGEHHEYGDDVLPYVRVEAARGLPYSCFGSALRTLERGGFADVTLRPAGEQVPDRRAYFAGFAARRYAAIVRLAGGRRMTWNGEAVDLAGLRRRVRAMDTRTLDDVAVAPSADADFMAVYETIRVVGQERVGQANLMPTLSGCAGTAGPVRDPPIC
jgi:hypothetical protein